MNKLKRFLVSSRAIHDKLHNNWNIKQYYALI